MLLKFPRCNSIFFILVLSGVSTSGSFAGRAMAIFHSVMIIAAKQNQRLFIFVSVFVAGGLHRNESRIIKSNIGF